MSDFAIDGWGAVADQELPDGTRIRVRLSESAADDLSIWVHRGELHIAGQYQTVHADRVAPNHVRVNSVRLMSRKG